MNRRIQQLRPHAATRRRVHEDLAALTTEVNAAIVERQPIEAEVQMYAPQHTDAQLYIRYTLKQ
jgi:hypothetical protein